MLDKFGSEYLVHFYSAVFIPNMICMSTEFAQFRDMHNLMKNKKNSEEIDIKIPVKMMLDSSK
ncbi:hypothetical protein EIN_288630, partial [Entamoeba invadens IP1]